ncbi:hypothetical protein RUND412_011013 [Rhizina undulata]
MNHELERRIKLLLADSQRLSQVLPLKEIKYTSLPPWTGGNINPAEREEAHTNSTENPNASDDFEPGSLAYIFFKSSPLHTFLKCSSFSGLGCNDGTFLRDQNMPANTFEDACQTLLSIAPGYDHGIRASVLQDTRTSNAIELQVVEVRTTSAVDRNLPILFVLFDLHENRVRVRPWLRKNADVNDVTATIEEQHLILQQLIYNSQQLPPGCEAMFETAKNQFEIKTFIPSFLLPLNPLSHAGLAELNRTDLNVESKLASSILCSGYDVALFHCPECQGNNCSSTHKHFCESVSSLRSIICRVEPSWNEKIEMESLSHVQALGDMIRNDVPTISPMREQIFANFARSRTCRGTKECFIVKIQASRHIEGDMGRDSLDIMTEVFSNQELFL